MNDIDIFIILYIIFGFLISFLVSFLFLKRYRNNQSKIPDNKFFKYAHIYYYCIINFSFIIFYILLVILDHALSSFKDLSHSFSDFVIIFYKIFAYYLLASSLIIIPSLKLYFTTGFYKNKDIVCDIIFRLVDIYVNKTNLIGVAIGLLLLIAVMIPYHEWILDATKINSFWSFWTFILFLTNYLNFLSYIKILFFIGFSIQNIIRVDSINRSETEYENFYLWKLGKVFIYYFNELTAVKECYEKADKKYNDYNSKDIKDKEFDGFKIHWESIKPNIEHILSTKLLKVKLDFSPVVDKYENKAKEKKDNENNNSNKSEKDKEEGITKENLNEKIQKIKNEYKERILAKRLFNFCNCCAKQKSEFCQFKDDICDKITIINEEVAKTFRKAYILDKIIVKLKNINYHEISCFRSLKCIKGLWIVFLIILIFLESPFQKLDEDEEEISISYNFINFLTALLIYSVSVIFYFSIFIYSIINHKNIQGDLIFGKNSEILNFLNFINLVFSLYPAAIYHSLWVFNKDGFINAKFYEIYFLPENIINIPVGDKNYTIKSLDIISYSTLAIIIISIFISSKYTELSFGGEPFLVYNENTEFFFSGIDFYLYFILGCICNSYDSELKYKEKINNNEELIQINSLNAPIKDENDDADADDEKGSITE